MPLLLYGYRLLTWLLFPLAPLFLYLRVLRGRENPARLKERFGQSHVPRPKGALIWIHAASVGEVVSALPLIDKILDQHKSLHILLTSGTLTSADIVARQPRERVTHQFVPLDMPPYVRGFLRHWQPDAAIFVESEIWLNLLRQMKSLAIPVALINGRLSAQSFASWQRAPDTIKKLLSYFTLILAQDDIAAERLAKLGGKNINMPGNLKLDAAPLTFSQSDMDALATQIGTRPTWLAASTHEPEEHKAAQAHIALKAAHKNLLTFIVPRHPHRGGEIKQQCTALGLRVAQRSLGEAIKTDTDIYLGDTIGEMGLFYRLVDIAFIGGSLVPHGGQNPIEAAQIGTAIITGPYIHNFSAVYQHFEKAAAHIKIKDDVELTQSVNKLLNDEKAMQDIQKRAMSMVASHGGAVEKTYQALRSLLPTQKNGGA